MGWEKHKLHEAYRNFAKDGRITAHEVKKTVEHCGGGNITEHHAGELLRSLAGWDNVITEHEFVTGIDKYVHTHGHHWGCHH